MNPSHVYVAIWPVDVSDGRPADMPIDWVVTPVMTASIPAWEIWNTSGELLLVIARINSLDVSGTLTGLYALSGKLDLLETIAATHPDVIAPGVEVWRLARPPTLHARARLACRACRSWRCDVTEMVNGVATQLNNVTRELSVEGTLLPDPAVIPLPWDLNALGVIVPTAQAVRRVRALHQPTLMWTIAGLSLHTLTEETPDRGA